MRATKTGQVKTKKEAAKSGWGMEKVILPLILIVTAIAYSNSLNNGILNFDDVEYFNNYPEVLKLNFNSIVQYFSKHYVLMYQPLPILTFAVNYNASGLNTFPMHLFNLLFHLGNIILIYTFIFRLRKNKNEALIVAFLFGIHPMNVEAVSWISARSSSMYVFFFLLGLNSYISYVRKEYPVKQLLLTVFFFLLSLFSKAQAVTFPMVLLLLDYIFERKLLSKKVILEKIPFFVLSVVFGLIALSDSGTQHNLTEGMLINYNAVDIVFLVTWSFAFYLVKMFVPLQLCSVYVYPLKENGMLPIQYYLSALIIAAVIWYIYKNRKDKWLLFCVGFFLFIISINIQVIPSRLFIVTERYAYLPYAGLFLLLVVYMGRWKEKNFASFRKNANLLWIAGIAYSVFFIFSVYGRNKVWANDLTLMDDIIEKNAEVPYLYRAYGIRGLHKINATGDFQGGIKDFTKAIEIYPADGKTYVNRALAFNRINNNTAAIADLDTAALRSPDRPEIFSYSAILRYQMGQQEQSWIDCNKCIQLDSTFNDCYITRGTVAFSRNDYQQSISDFTKAIALMPSSGVAYKNRGQVYMKLERKNESCSDFQEAINRGNQEAMQLQQSYCR